MASYTIFPDGLSSNLKLVAGQHTTAAAVDTETFDGINTIVSAVVCFATDPADANLYVSCSFSGGTLTIKTWKTANGADPTPTAATAFSKLVNYVVMGY